MTASLIAGLALTVLVGASLGLLGGGGSIVMLPVLVYVVGFEPHAAVPLSLAIVGGTSLLSVAVRKRAREIHWRTALIFGTSALAGSYFGGRLSYLVPGAVLLLAFGLLLVAVGIRMWRSAAERHDVVQGRRRPSLMAGAGAVVGLLTGILGVGGGFLIVPALVRVGGLDMAQAVRTSLVVLAMSSAAGLAGHVMHGNGVSVAVAAPLLLAALVGMAVGLQAATSLTSQHLQRGFAGFVTTVGSALILFNAPTAIGLLG